MRWLRSYLHGSSGLRRMSVSDDMVESIRLMHLRLEKIEKKCKRIPGSARTGQDRKRTPENPKFEVSYMSLKALPSWLARHHEWEAMKRDFLSASTAAPGLGRHVGYSYATLDSMIGQYNWYWKAITGRDVHFRFGKDSVKFLTVTEPALKRNEMLLKYFASDPVVMEPFAGPGADTVSFLFNLGAKQIYASDMTQKFSVDYIKRNVQSFQEAFPETRHVQVVLFNKRSATFLRELTEEIDEKGVTQAVHIDLLYLDPPWQLPGMDREATPLELLQFLNDEVFDPVFERGFTPKVIVVKTRSGWQEMRELMSQIQGYLHVDTIQATPFTNEINFHVLIVNRYTVTKWIPGKIYRYAYKGGEAPETLPDGKVRFIDYGEFEYQRSGRQ